MNSNINELLNTKYTLDDAFEIIKSSLGDSYQIINSMNNELGILKRQLEELKVENTQLKETILQLQNKLITLSRNLRQLSKDDQIDIKKANLKQKNLNKNKE